MANSSSGYESNRGYALFVAYSSNGPTHPNRVGMEILGLNHLTEISKGDVMFADNSRLCYATTYINWSDIFVDSNRQNITVINGADNQTMCNRAQCDESCVGSVISGSVERRYCWGPGVDHCQKISKVGCAEDCGGRRCFGKESNQCCHAECAGSCTGPTKSDCVSCRNFISFHGCEAYCPLQMIYDINRYKFVKNPFGMFTIGRLCVSHCPEQWLEHYSTCVKECPKGFKAKGNTCVSCGNKCSKTCRIRWAGSRDFLHAKNIHQLEGCTTIDGHLKILGLAFIRGVPHKGIPPLNVSSLQKLQSITEITEYLKIENMNGINVTNFGFLSNLKSIFPRSPVYRTALTVTGNRDVEFLGFHSLKKIKGSVFIDSNPKLCYLDGLKWEKLFTRVNARVRWSIGSNANHGSSCAPTGQVCHDECRNGCWGPTAKMCVSCQNYKRDGQCVPSCGTYSLRKNCSKGAPS